MTGDQHVIGLGKLVGNFHSLEHALRVFLCEANGEKLEYPTSSTSHVDESHLTSRQSLEPIIDKYNEGLTAIELKYRVDPEIVKFRDAVAHGRTGSEAKGFPLTLYKFSKAKDANGKIPVERVDVMTEAWFSEKINLVFKQIELVVECSKSRSYKMIIEDGAA